MRSARNVSGMRSMTLAAPRLRPNAGSYRRRHRRARRNAAAVVVSGNSRIQIYLSFLERRGWTWYSHSPRRITLRRGSHYLHIFTDGHYLLWLGTDGIAIYP